MLATRYLMEGNLRMLALLRMLRDIFLWEYHFFMRVWSKRIWSGWLTKKLNVAETLGQLCQPDLLLFIYACSNIINLPTENLSLAIVVITCQGLYLIFSQQNFRLWHLAYWPILILHEQSASMYAVVLIVLVNVYELNLSLLAFSVLHCLTWRL